MSDTLRKAKADQPDCSKCRHAAVLHNGRKLLCAAVFRGAWGPCTCPGYEARLAGDAATDEAEIEWSKKLPDGVPKG